VRIIAHANRHRADNADIIQAIVVNARDTIILLHAGRLLGVSCKHVNGNFEHFFMPLLDPHVLHRPMVNFVDSLVFDPLKHMSYL
jgi:hypothetical protein